MKVWNYHNLHELKEWPDYFVYIGREQPKIGLAGSVFANHKPPLQNTQQALRESLEDYRESLWSRVSQDKKFFDETKSLWGKHLVCFCVPAPCHGDILKELVTLIYKESLGFEQLQNLPNSIPELDGIAKKNQWVGWNLNPILSIKTPSSK